MRFSLILAILCFATTLASAGVQFDFVDDVVTLPAESAFGIEGGPLTFSAWIYVTDYHATNLTGRIVGKGGTGFAVVEAINTATFTNCVEFQKDYATTDLFRATADNTFSVILLKA